MITKIRKRDGREAPFNIEKIAQAIFKAAQAVGGKDYNSALALAEQVANSVEKECAEDNTLPTVEQIQDSVEKVLILSGHARTAKEFILYRAERTRVRDMNTKLMKVYEDLTYKAARDSDLKRENANINADSAMGIMLKYGSEGAKQFYEMFIVDPLQIKSHKDGDIHIHDFDFYALTTTCCQIDLDGLFTGGFSTGHGFLREPQYIESYAALACIAIQSNQNDQHGGQSIANFDYAMAKGVAKTYIKLYKQNIVKLTEVLCEIEDAKAEINAIYDEVKGAIGTPPALNNSNGFTEMLQSKLAEKYSPELAEKIVGAALKYAVKETERATYKAMVALVHNLNTMHSRAGAQIPFSSLNYGLDTSLEGRMVIRNILLAHEAGLGNGETPIFPIQIYRIKEGINYNPEDPNYDLFKLAIRVSAKRLFPNFSFIDAPYNLKFYKEGHPETEVAYMGCRTRVMSNYYAPDKEITYGRGNLSFTSLNLPRIAINANKNIDTFFADLDRKIDIIIDQLLARFKIQADKFVYNYPFLMEQGIWMDSDKLTRSDKVSEVLKHGTLSMGFIGLAEALTALLGHHHGQAQDAQNLGLEIIGHMRRRMDETTRKYGMNFTLIATPAEGLSGHFIRIDKEKFGIIDGITNKEYYTNSFHIPVGFDILATDKIKLEAPYHEFTNAGHITYVEVDGDPLQNLDAFEQLIRCMKEEGVGYGSINHPVDRDPVCGYTGIIGNECPMCGRTEDDGNLPFERIRRITGYLGTIDNFNNAKRAEVNDRVKHITMNGDFDC